MNSRIIHIIFGLLLLSKMCLAQHNNGMYLMHDVPESNLLNPAVRTPCRWYVGLPVLSSVHLNYANNMFSYKQLVGADNNVEVDQVVSHLHWRNYLETEFQTQLLAVGYNGPENSFVFTINEKNSLPVTMPKDAVELIWNGNSQFEGSTASMKGTGLYFNHYREFALSTSKPLFAGGYWGVRAKLLFGKLNVSSRSTNVSVATDENNFDLEFDGDMLVHTSLPIDAEVRNNELTSIALSDDFDLQKLLLNSKNPGFAIDLGIVYPYTDKIEISASILDMGFIRWRSNLNTFTANGNYIYQGVLNDTIPTNDYLNDLLDELMTSFSFDVTEEKYTTFLPTQILAGLNYKLLTGFDAGVMTRLQFYRSKVIPSLTLQGQYHPYPYLNIMASYTLQYYDYKQIGLGLVVGRRPLQFYAVTDNLIGAIWPLSTKSLNLRFGFNLIFGCEKAAGNNSHKTSSKGCYGMSRARKKPYMRKLDRQFFDRKY